MKINNATLIQGNCLEIIPTLGPFDHAIGDPPYESITHEAKASGRKLRKDSGPELKPLDFDSIDEQRVPFIETIAEPCQGWLIAFCTPEGVGRWADAINASPVRYKRACAWIKPDAAPQMNGQGPAAGYENFIAAWAGKGYSKWNGGGKHGVYTFRCNPPDRDGRHPTEKPIALMRRIIKDFTQPGDTILDPFMGSGTTIIAALAEGRRAIGIEINPTYFQIACDRVELFDRQGVLL